MLHRRLPLLLLPVILMTARCGVDLQVIHGIDHRLEAAERRLEEERRRSTVLAEQNARLQRDLAELAARVRTLAAVLESLRPRREAPVEVLPPRERVAPPVPMLPARAEVRILETRVFRRAGLPPGLKPALGVRLAAVRECFRTRVLAVDPAVTGAVWVLYGQIGADPFGVRFAAGHGGFHGCVAKELVPPARLATLGHHGPAGGERLAQLVVFGPDAPAVTRVARLRFAWPWPERQPPPGGQGAICAYGRMGGLDVLNPHAAPPCARGLRCCYPCGIQGCNSVCMARCPMGLP